MRTFKDHGQGLPAVWFKSRIGSRYEFFTNSATAPGPGIGIPRDQVPDRGLNNSIGITIFIVQDPVDFIPCRLVNVIVGREETWKEISGTVFTASKWWRARIGINTPA